jgi:hypothetical protein
MTRGPKIATPSCILNSSPLPISPRFLPPALVQGLLLSVGSVSDEGGALNLFLGVFLGEGLVLMMGGLLLLLLLVLLLVILRLLLLVVLGELDLKDLGEGFALVLGELLLLLLLLLLMLLVFLGETGLEDLGEALTGAPPCFALLAGGGGHGALC